LPRSFLACPREPLKTSLRWFLEVPEVLPKLDFLSIGLFAVPLVNIIAQQEKSVLAFQ
jgi:hypothetical protein